MGKKKRLKQQEKERKKKEMASIVKKGKCLTCGKPRVRNHKSCSACSKKKRLKSKANRRGKKQNYYLNN